MRLDGALDKLRVEARFASPVRELRVRSREGGRYLENASDCRSGQIFPQRGRHLEIPQEGTTCVEYVVDLRSAAADERRNASLAPDNAVVSPAVWLWRPSTGDGTRILLHFETADGVRASMPWPDREDGRYEMHPTPRNASAMAAFGRFDYYRRELPGSTLRVAIMRPRGRIDSEMLADWVHETAANVSLAYGRFPNPYQRLTR